MAIEEDIETSSDEEMSDDEEINLKILLMKLIAFIIKKN